MPKLIDAHTHAHFVAYGDESEDVVQRALDEDIWLITVGTQKDTSRRAVELAEQYKEGVYASIALHPIHTEKSYHDPQELGAGGDTKGFTSRGEDFDYEYYKKLGQSKKVVSIGECGLDYFRLEESTKDKQRDAFIQQIRLANELNIPLMIHCRNAFGDLIQILKDHKHLLKQDFPGVNHFFTSNKEDAKELMELGFYFTFGGVITFTHDYDEVIKYIGLDKIMVETDAPYVAPVPHRGKRNEPAFVKYTAEKLAEILDKDFEEVAQKTVENTRKVFSI
ncbi:MAG: hydrolase TatD [Candidatus Colwellbacteria bacterium CG10_big_fil_rev_8_21_14_0_10_42_22]|uniref:Hydrolase TatD n=1 Tax=Candidatus Colwellbacteria bacterium CG10_big_fil_rev_8_21_14_0_10_42_22 TaxID=1974540 RepID=A0A2H0VG23_9BACT|nr:MAG: hydrolase TatD [Candidatus Colwellbacteria bacterium CG10_big_fil_rev_8_21_14_0_10_42_22]